MHIIDLHGKEITIDNLELAIMKADDFRHYRHLDPEMADLDKRLKSYWEDFYAKLLELQKTEN